MFMPVCFMLHSSTPSDDRNLALVPLLLELLEALEELPEFSLVGVLCSLNLAVQGRPAVAAKALEHGVSVGINPIVTLEKQLLNIIGNLV